MKIGSLAVNIGSMCETDVSEVKTIEEENNLSPWSIEDYYNEIGRTDSISLVAKVDKRIIGFVIARLIKTINISSYDIEIYNICTIDEYRRNSIGKALIESLTKLPNLSIETIWVDVRK